MPLYISGVLVLVRSADVRRRAVLRVVPQVQAVQQRGQAPGGAVLREARAGHRLRRWLPEGVRLQVGAEGHARRDPLRDYVRP